MRLWTDGRTFFSDEQLLQRIATLGGLRAAAEKDDVTLLAGDPDDAFRPSGPRPQTAAAPRRPLRSYLDERA